MNFMEGKAEKLDRSSEELKGKVSEGWISQYIVWNFQKNKNTFKKKRHRYINIPFK